MATVKKTSGEKFVTFVNSRIGKQLSTIGISKGIRANLRVVQSLCKAARTKASKKVEYSLVGKGRTLGYTFKAPITSNDI